MKRYLKYYVAGLVFFVTFILYLNSLKNEFIGWDDDLYVYENPFIRSFGTDFFRRAFFDFHASNWHPLTWISHALDYAVWGLNPLGHHLTNNILHALNTFVVVLLVVRLAGVVRIGDKPPLPLLNQGGELLSESSPPIIGGVAEGRGGKRVDEHAILIAAATTGLLFGLHPLHVESVAWVSERKDLLCALFFMLSVMAYMSYVSYKTYKAYILTLVFFILALLSKPMAVTLPMVLLILDWYPLGRIPSFKSARAVFVEKVPFIVLSLVSSVLTVFAQETGGAISPVDAFPLSTRVLVGLKSLIAYLWKMIWPLNLVPFYPYPKDASLLSIEYFSAIVLVLGITIICIVTAKKQKLWLSAWGYYVVTLIPVLGIVQVGLQSMADRYAYLPSLGPFLLAGLMGGWVWARIQGLVKGGLIARILALAVSALLVVSLSYITFTQIGIWRNSIVFWSYVIEKEPERAPFAYYNRGLINEGMNQLDKAISDYGKAIAINPSYSRAYNNRGIVFNRMGQPEKAMEDFNKAIASDASNAQSFINRGLLYLKINKVGLAVSDFKQACVLGENFGCKMEQYALRIQ
jgi:hypothetical protein